MMYKISDKVSKSNHKKELWVLKLVYGNFLKRDCRKLAGSSAPSFWQANNEALSLTCTTDTPPRCDHYRQSWIK